jgi:hypothetical protein
MDLVRVVEAEKAGLPFKPATYYRWWHLRKNTQIFVKLGGALFVDRDRHSALLESRRGERLKR